MFSTYSFVEKGSYRRHGNLTELTEIVISV